MSPAGARPAVAVLGPPPTDRGGIAQQTRLLAEHLGENLSAYFCYSRRYPGWLDPRRFDELPSAESPLPTSAIFDYASPLSWTRTARAVESSSADALLVPWWTSFWAIPLAGLFARLGSSGRGPRRVLVCHNVVEHETSRTREFLSRRAFTRADAFVVHSPEDRDRLRRLAPSAPSICLPHAVEERARPDREQSRRRLAVDGPLVLFLGLVRRYKGVETLVAAAPRIAASGARIAIVGEVFPDARFLRKLIAACPARESLRLVDRYVEESEMDAWLAASDVVVCPYRRISGSGIAARAVAAGRPVVASDLPGFRLLISNQTGELVAPGNPEALAEAVLRVIDRGIDFYAPGLAEAARRCSWTSYVSALLGFLDSRDDPAAHGSGPGLR